MNKNLYRLSVGILCGAALLLAQPAQPKPKSQKELDALMAIQNATDPDARIAAVDNLLLTFADTEFKSMALQMAVGAAQQKNDYEKIVLYSDRALEADPKNYVVLLTLAGEIARHTRAFDLDKEEKLAKSEKYAKSAQELIKTAQKPRPDLTDVQFEAAKKDMEAQAHETMGLIALVRKKNDVAISEFKAAMDVASTPDPATMVRLGDAYLVAGKPDEAIIVLDKVLAIPDVNPQIKQFAQAKKLDATKKKASGSSGPPTAGTAPASTPPASTSTAKPPVDSKKP